MTESKMYSCEYERDGYIYSLPLYCTLEEAEWHSDSLGIGEPEEVVAIIPDMRVGLN